MSLVSLSPHENKLLPPHPHHSSLSKNIHSTSLRPHQTSRPLSPRSCTYKQLNESSLLKRLCFSPHTTITHPYQKTELCFINPHQPSHLRRFTTKIVVMMWCAECEKSREKGLKCVCAHKGAIICAHAQINWKQMV